MASYDFFSSEFDEAAASGGRKAFADALAAGLPVFYVDDNGLTVMQEHDGRRFEICWLPGEPSGRNYRVIRELTVHAA